MRKVRRKRKKDQTKIIIPISICLLLIMTAGYATFSTNLSITAKGNILEQDRVIQSWSATSNEDFHTDYYRENIVSATFLDNNNIPDNATEYWNVSEDKEKGGVIAYVVPNSDDNTKYDLYIGANKGVIANPDSSYLFDLFIGLEIIDFNDNFDTSNVENMNFMFSGHWIDNGANGITMSMNLKQIMGLENFDTHNVTNMKGMFLFCTELTSLNVSSFNTANVTDMSFMFNQLQSLTNINLSNFNTSNVSNMERMFRDSGFVNLDLSNFNTSNVTNMDTMFYGNTNLESLDVSSFNTTNVTNMIAMFALTDSLKYIYVGHNWTTANADTTNMFYRSNISSVTPKY